MQVKKIRSEMVEKVIDVEVPFYYKYEDVDSGSKYITWGKISPREHIKIKYCLRKNGFEEDEERYTSSIEISLVKFPQRDSWLFDPKYASSEVEFKKAEIAMGAFFARWKYEK